MRNLLWPLTRKPFIRPLKDVDGSISADIRGRRKNYFEVQLFAELFDRRSRTFNASVNIAIRFTVKSLTDSSHIVHRGARIIVFVWRRVHVFRPLAAD